MGKRKRAARKRKSKAFLARSTSAKKGWESRRWKALLRPAVERFAAARQVGSHADIDAAHKRLLRVRSHARHFLGGRFRRVLDDIGEGLDLDEEFVDALDDSPDTPG